MGARIREMKINPKLFIDCLIKRLSEPVLYKYYEADLEDVWYGDIVDSPSDCREPRDADKQTVHLIGAPRESAVRLLNILSTKLDKTKGELRWWSGDVWGQNCDNKLVGCWKGYDPQRGFYEIPQQHGFFDNNIILLYYSDGPDPARLLPRVFENDSQHLSPLYMILPIAEHVYDYKSTRHITASLNAPFLRVRNSVEEYAAPITPDLLECIPLEKLLVEGRGLIKLGEKAHKANWIIRMEN